MKKITKRIFLVLSVFLFFVITPLVIYYSQGYRFDLKQKKIVETGGLFIHAEPKGAQIFINGKEKKKTSFFFGSALIENLMPGTYEIKVQKYGFRPWKKTLDIKEKIVTSAKNIQLLPETLEFTLNSRKTIDIYPSPSGKWVIFSEEETNKGQKSWALKLLNLDSNLKSQLITEEQVRQEIPKGKEKAESAVIEKIIWGNEEKTILLQAKTETGKAFLALDLSFPSLSLLPVQENAQSVQFYPNPKKENSIIFLLPDEQESFTLFLQNKENKEIIAPRVLNYVLNGNEIIWLNADGYFFKKSGDRDPVQIFKISAPLLAPTPAIYLLQSNIFVLIEGKLIQCDLEKQETREIATDVVSISVSPGGNKLLFYNSHEIGILFLKEQNIQPVRKQGEKIFLARRSNEIKSVFWLNGYYVLATEKKLETNVFELEVIETDTRNGGQSWMLAQPWKNASQANESTADSRPDQLSKNETKSANAVFFSPGCKKLLVLHQGELYLSNSLQFK